tara:strand:+ start:174 stop:656 length:483 start_codon:yes stop_codon:yes gene_type:complete
MGSGIYSMPYKYDADKQIMVSQEDDKVFLTSRGADRHRGGMLLLFHWGDKVIGISNGDGDGNSEPNTRLSDGTVVFHLNQIGVSIHDTREPWPILTNFRGFDSELEQNQFLKILSDIFAGFDFHHDRMMKGIAKGRIEITPALQKRLKNGEFLRIPGTPY